MKNFTSNEAEITEAFKNGIVCKSDYNLYMGTLAYQQQLKKSLDHQDITGSEYTNEQAKAHGVHWYRSEDRSTFRFVLKGANFLPLDLISIRSSNALKKAKDNVGLLKSQSHNTESKPLIKATDIGAIIANNWKGAIANIDKLINECAALNVDIKKGTERLKLGKK